MPYSNYTGEPEIIFCPNSKSSVGGVVNLATGLVVLILTLFAISLNSLLLFTIFSKPITRSLHALIANLSFVSILAAGLGAVYICGLDTLFTDLWICSSFSFLRNVVTALISLSVLSISYERVRKVDSDSILVVGELLVCRTISCIWIFSFLGSIPSLFATILVSHAHPGGGVHSICMKSPPDDKFALGVIYEVFRSFVFHISVPAYMIFELYRIRATVSRFLLGPTCSKMQRKVGRRVRFIYIYTIIFILIWFPYGVGISIYKNTTLTHRYEKFVNHPELDCEDGVKLGKKSIAFYILGSLFYVYIVLLPLLIFFSNDTFSSVQPILGKACWCTEDQTLNAFSPKDEVEAGGQDCEGTKWKGDTTFAISDKCSETQLQIPEGNLKLGDKDENDEPSIVPIFPVETHKPVTYSVSQELLV